MPAHESATIAVIQDDPSVRAAMLSCVREAGHSAFTVESSHLDLARVIAEADVVCLDVVVGDMSGLDVLRHLSSRDPELPVLIVTSMEDIGEAIRAMRAGAFDYLVKPLDTEKLRRAIAHAVDRRKLTVDLRRLRGALEDRPAASSTLIGDSAHMVELARQLERAADEDGTVCIQGERGTGKELVARSIHDGSERRIEPFVVINCAAIPDALIAAELFGSDAGGRRGRFEEAAAGTLMIDEIQELSRSSQRMLLHALIRGSAQRVDGGEEFPLRARVIAASRRDLDQAVRTGEFDAELYSHLCGTLITVPALRDRIDDVPSLVAHFLARFGGDARVGIDPDALDALAAWKWPGNIRELQTTVRHALLACDGGRIQLSHLPQRIRSSALTQRAAGVIPLRELERRAIASALEATGGSVTKAAKLLGIGRATLYRRLSSPEMADIRQAGRASTDADAAAS